MESILITGGTGSFGKEFVKTILKKYPNIKRLAIYSRDELKQFEMAQIFSPAKYPALRYFIGDIRDKDRLKRALQGIDIVIHAAALKHVPIAEYNPFECIKTNVLGAQNLIEAAIETGVKKIVALSTDKAAAPINLYGATKLCSDKLFIAANNISGRHDITFSVVRYGNVMGSRGSVIPFFLNKQKENVLPITHPDMTRFNISLQDGVKLVFFALEKALGGEIFIPKIPSYRIVDVAKAICPKGEFPVIGIRPGEKIHEEMITSTDSLNTIELENHFIIVPNGTDSSHQKQMEKFANYHKGRIVEEGFSYSSGENDDWLSASDMQKLIKEYVDPNFVA